MKIKLTSILLCLSILLSLLNLTSCATNTQCEINTALEALKKVDTVKVTTYSGNEGTVTIKTSDSLFNSLKGDYTKADKFNKGNKLVSITVNMQYEICFFDNSQVMVYYGFSGLFNSDRQYYNVALDSGTEMLLNYITNFQKSIHYRH